MPADWTAPELTVSKDIAGVVCGMLAFITIIVTEMAIQQDDEVLR